MLTECLVAAVLVLAPVVGDEPGPASSVDGVAGVAPVGTETVVTVTPLDGELVRVGILVTGADGSVPDGRVGVRDGGRTVAQVPLTDGGATLVTGAVGEDAVITAAYAGDAEHLPSTSPARATGAVAAQDGASVTVSIPAGALTVSLVPGRPDTLRVTDTRAGERGFTVSAAATLAGPARMRALPVVVRPIQVPGYALQADDACAPSPIVLLSYRPTTVLTYPAHHSLGALDLQWRALGRAGGGAATVVWTVM